MAQSLDADKAAEAAEVIETPGVTEESPPPDVSDSSPEQTHEEFLKSQLEGTEEKSSEEPQGDEVADPEKDGEAETEPETTDESTDPEAKKPEEDTASADEDPADIPEDEFKALAPKSQERFQKVVNERNEISKRVEELSKYQQDVQATIKAANATPDQMADILEFTRMENSDNPEDKRAALNLAVEKVKALSAELGVKVPGTDILEGHEDLSERVEQGEIELSDAEELAIARNKEKLLQSRKEVETKKTEETKSQQQIVADVAEEIGSLFESRRTTDPDWAAKLDLLKPYSEEIKAQFEVKDYPKLLKLRLNQLDNEFERAKPKPDPKEDLPSSPSSSSSAKVEPVGHEAFVAQAFKR